MKIFFIFNIGPLELSMDQEIEFIIIKIVFPKAPGRGVKVNVKRKLDNRFFFQRSQNEKKNF